jgi:hypothetical protein
MSEEGTINNQPGLVMGPGPEGWWDSERVSCPQVLREEDGTFKMWYYGRDALFDRMINIPSGRCGMAISKDGVNWERVRGPLTMGSVFEPVPASENRFDNGHVGVSDICFDNGLYWMWYFGGGQQPIEISTPRGKVNAKGFNMLPGCAVSRDGLNWTRLNGPHRGAFLDYGTEGEWDSFFCSWPKVLKENDVSKAGNYNIGLAVSDDGIKWCRDESGKPVFSHAPSGSGRWDAKSVGTPYIVPMPDGSYRMYYIGVNEGGHDALSSQQQIGMAVSDGPDFRKWRRWGE